MELSQSVIHFSEKGLDTHIYRVMPAHRLFEIFESKQLTLVQPGKWDDPFENLILKGLISGILDRFPASKVFRNYIYGQCWTLQRESDAMWRIYSQDKNGVRVRCTIRTLLESIHHFNPDANLESIFIGKVEYLTQKDLISKLTSVEDIYGKEAAKSLLYKRMEFKHESEARLICTSGIGETQKLSIDPNKVFDEIVFDPRMNQHIYKAYSGLLSSQGFGNRVSKSVLYQLPKELRGNF